MNLPLIFFTLVALTVAAPSKETRDTSPPCSTGEYLSVQNAQYQMSQTGLYVATTSSCDLTSTSYVTVGITNEYTTYLYYHNGLGFWLAGPNPPSDCSTVVGAYGTGGDNSSPLTVTVWNEWDGATWAPATSYTVVCIVSPCDTQLLISGSTCEDPAEGLYDLAPESYWCSARPAFQMGSYALTFNLTYQAWVFGPDPCSTLANVAAFPTLVNYPYDFTGLWSDPCFGSFVENAAYRVVPSCPALDSHHPKRRHGNHIYNNIKPGEGSNVRENMVPLKDRIPVRPMYGHL